MDSLPSLSSGILKRECAVRPFGKIDAATPEVAVASAILLADLMVVSKVRYRKVLPVPPGPSMKKEFSKCNWRAITDGCISNKLNLYIRHIASGGVTHLADWNAVISSTTSLVCCAMILNTILSCPL
ncbi:uncharacterized protein LOC131324114 isoform X1 [Rhododendron vialii]|uniref:uncharacterized protein LOC131324114 isoform X1 n=1 Tax=Rhododendron vialii TaxID=182163 RepID=UPI00265F624B|nr:uncharacterized protein LOC131324114 isoform X1 [Rhododendron vialii]